MHVDVKKLGRIPDGGGHRVLGRTRGVANQPIKGCGYAFLHLAVADHSRLTYSEILTDERKDITAAFWKQADAWFAERGITVLRVLTDNGNAYRSGAWKEALGARVTHKRTRPYRPQTNGKVERFNRTLLEEWAYARPYASDAERVAVYPDCLHTCNHHRPHRARRPLTSRSCPQLGGREHLGRPGTSQPVSGWSAETKRLRSRGLEGGQKILEGGFAEQTVDVARCSSSRHRNSELATCSPHTESLQTYE